MAMKKLLILVLAIALVLPATAMARTATITWNPPEARTDGTPLALDELEGYVFSCRPSGEEGHADKLVIEPGTLDRYVTTYEALFGETLGDYWCAMRAVDTAGLESPLSNEVLVQHLAGPGAPTDLEIITERPNIFERITGSVIGRLFR